MRWALWTLVVLMLLAASLRAQETRSDPGAPLRRLTPGTTDSRRRAVVCVPGYATAIRSVSASRKDSVYRRYHLSKAERGGYVIDHLIPLAIGGSNRISNLFPQDTASAREKDRLEKWARYAVCLHGWSLRTLQRAIAVNWRTVSKQQARAIAALDTVPARR